MTSRASVGHTERMTLSGASWLLWLVGTLLIAGSWFQLVSAKIGWIGFAVAMLGSVLSWCRPRPPAAPPGPPSQGIVDLERLSDLRDRGVLSEEEFAAQKKKLLGP